MLTITGQIVLKMNRFQIPLVVLMVLSLVGLGLASAPIPCCCEKAKGPAASLPRHQDRDCCEPPAAASPADCPCGDDCHPAFQAPARDVIVSFSDYNLIPSLESGRSPFLSSGIVPRKPGLVDPLFLLHGPPPETLYLRTNSLRC
jgi:hypothetical protein